MNYIKILIISIFLFNCSAESEAKITVLEQSDGSKKYFSTNVFNRDGAKINASFSYLDIVDTAYLSVTIKDEKDFWAFDSSEDVVVFINKDNNNKKTYYLEINDPETWVEDDRIFGSMAIMVISKEMLESVLNANKVRFMFEFVNIYVRRFGFTLDFDQEALDEWYYVYKGVTRKGEKEYKEKGEKEKLLNQLGYENEKAIFPQHYTEHESLSSRNILYETGTTIKLRNSSDTVVAIYKDQSLKNITNLFTNDITATVLDYILNQSKQTTYKVQIFLKDGSEYVGWVPESIISN